MGLKSGNTSSSTAFFKMLNATGWNRKFSCSHESRVNASIRIENLGVRSTNLNKRVQVGHPFIIRVVEIDLPPRTDGGTGGSDLIPKFLLDLWVLCELEEGEGQRVGTGFIWENRLVRKRDAG